MQTARYGNWLQTYTGIPFYPLDPRPGDINIEDIAHALSNICRYGGHCAKFLSVAQHSCIVSKLIPKGMELWGLLHDASEAYLVDIPRPIKEYLPDYHKIENACIKAIAEKFGLQLPIPEEVKIADNAVLKLERERLMVQAPQCMWQVDEMDIVLPWYKGDYMNIEFYPQKPARAEQEFIERYWRILKGGNYA